MADISTFANSPSQYVFTQDNGFIESEPLSLSFSSTGTSCGDPPEPNWSTHPNTPSSSEFKIQPLPQVLSGRSSAHYYPSQNLRDQEWKPSAILSAEVPPFPMPAPYPPSSTYDSHENTIPPGAIWMNEGGQSQAAENPYRGSDPSLNDDIRGTSTPLPQNTNESVPEASSVSSQQTHSSLSTPATSAWPKQVSTQSEPIWRPRPPGYKPLPQRSRPWPEPHQSGSGPAVMFPAGAVTGGQPDYSYQAGTDTSMAEPSSVLDTERTPTQASVARLSRFAPFSQDYDWQYGSQPQETTHANCNAFSNYQLQHSEGAQTDRDTSSSSYGQLSIPEIVLTTPSDDLAALKQIPILLPGGGILAGRRPPPGSEAIDLTGVHDEAEVARLLMPQVVAPSQPVAPDAITVDNVTDSGSSASGSKDAISKVPTPWNHRP
jgi:hypothetical protein